MTQEKDPSEKESRPEDNSGSEQELSTSELIAETPSAFGPDAVLRVGSSFGSIEDESPAESFDSIIGGSSTVTATETLLTDDSSPTPKSAKVSGEKNPLKTLLVTAGVLVLVVALGFFGLMGWDAYQEQKKADQQQSQEQAAEREKAKAIREADNPFSVLVGKVDPPSEEPLAASVENNQLKIGESTLTVRDGTLVPTANGCSLGAITDICLGARGKLGDGDFDVLLVKDISRTRILDDPSEFKEMKTAGGTIAASLAIDMGNQEGPSRFGVLTANGTTGFVLIFPAGTSAERVAEVLKAATVI